MVEQSEITPYGGNSRENTYGMAQSSWKDSNNPDGHQFDEAFVIEKPAIKLRGLPFSVTEDDIVQFFHGYNLIESSIKIGRYANGKLTGDGSVLFDSSLDAKQAFTEKYKHNIGSRYIELFQITQQEHENFQNDQQNRAERTQRGGYQSGDFQERRGFDQSTRGYRGNRSRGGNNYDNYRPPAESFQGRGRGSQKYFTSRSDPYDEEPGQKQEHSDYGKPQSKNFYQPQHEEEDEITQPQNQRQNSFQKSNNFVRLSDYVTEENKMLCVKIRGLPYSADERQIRNFFADFRVAERDIIIDKAHGQPTGYALVFLESEAEALRAKNTLDREYVGNRYVDVFFPDVKK